MKSLTPCLVAFAVAVATPAFASEEADAAYAEIEATVQQMQQARQARNKAEFEKHLDTLYQQAGAFLDQHLDQATEEQVNQTAGAWLQIANMKNDTEALEARIATLKGHEKVSDELENLISVVEAKLNIKPGNQAPGWTATDIHSGEEVTLQSLRGKLVLMDFWATWCGPCRALMERELKPLWEQYKDAEDFVLVGIGVPWSGETLEKEKEFAEEHEGYGWTKVFNASGEAPKAYGVDGIPFLVLVDEQGKILSVGSGWAVIEEIKAKLAERLGGESGAGADEGAVEEGMGGE